MKSAHNKPWEDGGGPLNDPTDRIPGLSLQQAEELSRLGTLRETYVSDPSSRRGNARLLWFGFTFFLLMQLLVLAIPFLPPPKDVAPAPLPLVVFFNLFIAFFLVACGWRLRQLAGGKRVRIMVFTEGMARFDGKNFVTCRWHEIESVQGIVKTYRVNFAPVGSRFIISVKFGGDQRMRIDGAKEHLAGMDFLLQRIAEESGRHLFPRYFAAVEAGETVNFKPHVWGVVELGISKSGLHWGKRVVAWNDAENIDLGDGLRVRNPNTWPLRPWVRLADMPIPNHLVFMQLAAHYLRENGHGVVPAR